LRCLTVVEPGDERYTFDLSDVAPQKSAPHRPQARLGLIVIQPRNDRNVSVADGTPSPRLLAAAEPGPSASARPSLWRRLWRKRPR
jgi:hypothetical protein